MTESVQQERPKRSLRVLGWMLVPLILLAALGAWFALDPGFRWGHGGTRVAADMPKDQFERRVRAFLLEHPEVIAQAISRLESRRGEEEATEAQAALKSRADEVFRDPDSPVGGNPHGDVTLVEFFDYNCPYCRQVAPLMLQAEAADPKLRLVFKEFPILGAGSTFAAKAALAAHKQGKYLAFHHALMKVRGKVEATQVVEVAKATWLDVDRLKADAEAPEIQAMLERTSTPHAPWYVIPSDRKWYRNVAMSTILRRTMENLELKFPPAPEGLDKIVIE